MGSRDRCNYCGKHKKTPVFRVGTKTQVRVFKASLNKY